MTPASVSPGRQVIKPVSNLISAPSYAVTSDQNWIGASALLHKSVQTCSTFVPRED